MTTVKPFYWTCIRPTGRFLQWQHISCALLKPENSAELRRKLWIDQTLKRAEMSSCSGGKQSWRCILELVEDEVLTKKKFGPSLRFWIFKPAFLIFLFVSNSDLFFFPAQVPQHQNYILVVSFVLMIWISWPRVSSWCWFSFIFTLLLGGLNPSYSALRVKKPYFNNCFSIPKWHYGDH